MIGQTGAMDSDTTFASRSVREHVVRGILGIGLLLAAFVLIPSVGGISLALAVPAVVLLRGCPTCWVLGLAQTRAAVEREADCAPCARR